MAAADPTDVRPESATAEVAQAADAPDVWIERAVAFYLAGQRYALPIDRVNEIQQIVAFSDVPAGGQGVVGMVNLRGSVIPAIDVRRLIGLEAREYTLETPMIITRTGVQTVALVVDEVEDVIELPEGCLQGAPPMHALSSKMIGVCRLPDGLMYLLDIDKLLGGMVGGESSMSDTESRGHMAQSADQVLEDRAASLALETLDEEISDQLSLMLFRIADEWYAVRVGDVREIFQEYEITKIPCVPDFIMGVVNVRGEILSVTDPARLMRLGEITAPEGQMPPAIVVVNDDTATAIVVDEIGDIAEVPNGSVEPPVSIIDRAQAEFVSGSVFVNDNMIGMLNVERLLTPVGGVAGRS